MIIRIPIELQIPVATIFPRWMFKSQAKKKQIFVKFSVEKGDAAAAEMAGAAPPVEAW